MDALLAHPLVRAISFVGSSPVAKYVYQTAAAHGKRVQALGGAKNHLVVMPDAHARKSVEAIMGSAFGAAGERCLAGSVLVLVGDARSRCWMRCWQSSRSADRRRRRARYRNGAAGDGGSSRARARLYRERRGRRRAAFSGWTRRMDGHGDGCFLGPTVFDNVTPGMTIAREEIFGPVLSVIRVKDLDEAIALVNSSAFGNTTSIFTADGKSAREYASRVEVGMVGVNVGVAAPMAFFPFSGWKNSFLRRSARAWAGCGGVLYGAEGDHEPVVLSRFEYPEGGDTLEEFLEGFPTVPRELLALEALEDAKELLLTRV